MTTTAKAGFFRDGYELGKRLGNDAPKAYELLRQMLRANDIDNAMITISAIAVQCGIKVALPASEFNLRKFLYGLSLTIDTKREYVIA